MGTARIEQIIDDIIDFLDTCKPAALSKGNIIVPKDDIFDLLDELKLRTPDEIKRYQKIIANRDAIMKDAEMKAAKIIADAQEKAERMISEHEIMQQAYAQANEIIAQATEKAQLILDNATKDANEIRIGAIQYTDELLGSLHNIVNHAIDSASAKYDNLILDLKRTCEIIDTNRASLSATDEPESAAETTEAATETVE